MVLQATLWGSTLGVVALGLIWALLWLLRFLPSVDEPGSAYAGITLVLAAAGVGVTLGVSISNHRHEARRSEVEDGARTAERRRLAAEEIAQWESRLFAKPESDRLAAVALGDVLQGHPLLGHSVEVVLVEHVRRLLAEPQATVARPWLASAMSSLQTEDGLHASDLVVAEGATVALPLPPSVPLVIENLRMNDGSTVEVRAENGLSLSTAHMGDDSTLVVRGAGFAELHCTGGSGARVLLDRLSDTQMVLVMSGPWLGAHGEPSWERADVEVRFGNRFALEEPTPLALVGSSVLRLVCSDRYTKVKGLRLEQIRGDGRVELEGLTLQGLVELPGLQVSMIDCVLDDATLSCRLGTVIELTDTALTGTTVKVTGQPSCQGTSGERSLGALDLIWSRANHVLEVHATSALEPRGASVRMAVEREGLKVTAPTGEGSQATALVGV